VVKPFSFQAHQYHGCSWHKLRFVSWWAWLPAASTPAGNLRHLPPYTKRGESLLPDSLEHRTGDPQPLHASANWEGWIVSYLPAITVLQTDLHGWATSSARPLRILAKH